MQFISIDTGIFSLYAPAEDIYRVDLQQRDMKGSLTLYTRSYPNGYQYKSNDQMGALIVYLQLFEQLKFKDFDFISLEGATRKICVRQVNIRGLVYDRYIDDTQLQVYIVKLRLAGPSGSEVIFYENRKGDYNAAQREYYKLRSQLALTPKIAHNSHGFWNAKKPNENRAELDKDWVLVNV